MWCRIQLEILFIDTLKSFLAINAKHKHASIVVFLATRFAKLFLDSSIVRSNYI